MFSPQLNEAKYNLLSADTNKCGGKWKCYRCRFFACENSNLQNKIQKKAGKCLNRHWIIKKENRPLAGFAVTNILLCYCAGACCLLLCYCYEIMSSNILELLKGW